MEPEIVWRTEHGVVITTIDGEDYMHEPEERGEMLRDILLNAEAKDVMSHIRDWHAKDVVQPDRAWLKCGCTVWLDELDWESTRSMRRTHECPKMPIGLPGVEAPPRHWHIVQSFVLTPSAMHALDDSVCPTPCGCETEPDGVCDEHGVKSWLLLLGVI